MGTLIDVFHQYSGREGDRLRLKKSELKALLEEQLPHFLEVSPAQTQGACPPLTTPHVLFSAVPSDSGYLGAPGSLPEAYLNH